MKTITLIRHGKSSWEFDVSDDERPLKTRGIRDTQLVAESYKTFNFVPEAIFSSPANRALSTCKIFLNVLNIDMSNIQIVEELYDFSGDMVINFIKSLPDHYNNVMIFGHNHAFTSISNIFGDNFIDNLPTAGLVRLSFSTDTWRSVDKGRTEMIIFPRDLK